MWTIFKVLIEFVTILLLLFLCPGFSVGCEAYGILAPWPGIEHISPALEGEDLTIGPSGKSQKCIFSKITNPNLLGWGGERCNLNWLCKRLITCGYLHVAFLQDRSEDYHSSRLNTLLNTKILKKKPQHSFKKSIIYFLTCKKFRRQFLFHVQNSMNRYMFHFLSMNLIPELRS